MDLAAIRDRIAGNGPAGIHGHARPPGQIRAFPAYVVGDPSQILFRQSYGGRTHVTFPVTVIVARTAEQDGTAALDALLSTLPGDLEAITPDGLWQPRDGLFVTEISGGYRDYGQADREGRITVIGLAAELTTTVHV